MTDYENRSMTAPAIIVGVCLLIGLALGGYFIGTGGCPL